MHLRSSSAPTYLWMSSVRFSRETIWTESRKVTRRQLELCGPAAASRSPAVTDNERSRVTFRTAACKGLLTDRTNASLHPCSNFPIITPDGLRSSSAT